MGIRVTLIPCEFYAMGIPWGWDDPYPMGRLSRGIIPWDYCPMGRPMGSHGDGIILIPRNSYKMGHRMGLLSHGDGVTLIA